MNSVVVTFVLAIFLRIPLLAQNNSMAEKIKFKPFWTKKQVQELFKKYHLKERNDLRMGTSLQPYELPDGKLIFVMGHGHGDATMYRSEEELKKMMDEPDVRKSGEHVLSDLIPDKDYFLTNIDRYIELLAHTLKIPRAALDKSLKSVKLIDSCYKKNRPADKNAFFRKDYLYIIAYLGEVYKQKFGGDWVFDTMPNVSSFLPSILTKSGRKLDTFLYLFKECYEHWENFSISLVAYGEAGTDR